MITNETVLIVDDDPLFCAAAAACLRKDKFDVQVAEDGLQALELIKPGVFAAALIDLDMPKVDGARLIGLLRGDRRLNTMAIIVISSSRDLRVFGTVLDYGADNFQGKPVDWRSLPLRVRHEISRRRSLAELLDFQSRTLAARVKLCGQDEARH